MVQIAKVDYSKTIRKFLANYWDEALLIFGFMMLINYLAYSGSDIARQGFFNAFGWLGGSALLGWALISIGMAMIPLGTVSGGTLSIIGIILTAVGGLMVGTSITVVFVWIKNNLWLVGGISLAVLFLLRSMRSGKKPVQNIYYVQSKNQLPVRR